MLVLGHLHPYRTDVYLFQPCQSRQSVPCLSTEQSAHISQMNWTLEVERAQALYGLPSVSGPLATFEPESPQHPRNGHVSVRTLSRQFNTH